jgi:sugar phosphate isomerase/epimerase
MGRIDRRQFIRTLGSCAFGALATTALAETALRPDEQRRKERGVNWQTGCFNRPWGRWGYDAALEGMKTAGYRLTGILGDHAGEPFLTPEATPDYLDSLKRRIADRGLTPVIGWLRTRHDIPLEESVRLARIQIDNGQRMGLKYLMTVGVDPREAYDHFYRVMAESAKYAAERGIQIVLKPHGGCSAAADELLTCVERVGHANFRIWFDAGNIIHYTGKDPVAEVARVASLVTGFCAKDCAKPGGDVMLQFGDGKVDFRGVFRALKTAGFSGPVMVECCAGQTPEEVTQKARENRLFLEKLFASL